MDKRKPRLVYDEKDQRPGDVLAVSKTINNVTVSPSDRFKIVVELDGEIIYCAPYTMGETHVFPKGLPVGKWEIKIRPYVEQPKDFRFTYSRVKE